MQLYFKEIVWYGLEERHFLKKSKSYLTEKCYTNQTFLQDDNYSNLVWINFRIYYMHNIPRRAQA